MVEVEGALFLSIFEIAFSGGCCSRSLLRAVEIIEHELVDRDQAIPHWFLPSTPSGLNRGDSPDDSDDRPNKRRRLGSLEPLSTIPVRMFIYNAVLPSNLYVPRHPCAFLENSLCGSATDSAFLLLPHPSVQ